jgi:hypothetical protein
MIIPYELTDQCDQPNDKPTLPIKIVGNGGQILIGFQGYGEHGADVEHATPVLIEVWDGKLRVIIWSDVNQEDPTHTIELEAARENNRQNLDWAETHSAAAKKLVEENIWNSYWLFPRSDWQYETANGDTSLGYWNWVDNQIESHSTDSIEDRSDLESRMETFSENE